MNATTSLRTTAAPSPGAESRAANPTTRTQRILARLDAWFTALQMREVEAYLAQAQDTADLERRINRLQDARRSQSLLMR
jgi:hypothetical protein